MELEPDAWPPLVELPDCADRLDPEVPRLPDEPAPLLAPRPLDEEPEEPLAELPLPELPLADMPDEEPDWLLCDDEPDMLEEPEVPRFDEPDWPLCDEEPELPPREELPLDEPDEPLCCEPERPLCDELPDMPLCDDPDRPLCDEPDLLPCDEPEELPDSPLCCEPDEAFEPDALPDDEERTSLPMLVPDSRPWPLPLLPAFDF
jgi:hypothetical protein